MTFVLIAALLVLLTVAIATGLITVAGVDYLLDDLFPSKRDYVLIVAFYAAFVLSLAGAVTVLTALF